MTGPSMAPAQQNEIVAVANPGAQTWSVRVPGKQWVVVPAAQGGAVLAACVGGSPGATFYTIWRVVQSDGGAGITKCAQGAVGRPVSSRMAAALKRMGCLPAAPAGTVGAPAAAEAPVQFQMNASEVSEFGNSVPSQVMQDAEAITPEDVGGGTAIVQAGTGGDVPATPAADPNAGTPPMILGIPLPKLLVLAGLGWAGYKAYRKFKGKERPARRNRSRYKDDPEDDDDEEDDDNGDE